VPDQLAKPCITIVCALAVSLALMGSIPSAAQDPLPLLPLDEATTRPDFFIFRAHLQAVLAQRDLDGLLKVVDPRIRSSFGDDEGIEAFKKLWRIDEPDSELWRELATVLALGGAFDAAGNFTAPYTFSRWPQGADSFENVAVMGSNVRIRTEPRIDAPTIASVSFSVLRLDAEAFRSDWTRNEWTAVRFNGRKGYIATRYIRSPIDYRASFTYTDGRWLLTLFVAGD
jgi:hypothetical protein